MEYDLVYKSWPWVSHHEASRVYDRLSAAIYGHVVGDAIGHLTETLSKEQAQKVYGSVSGQLELGHKKLLDDVVRRRWGLADWTEESDLMLMLIESLLYARGQIDKVDIAKRLMDWLERGFAELHRSTCGQSLDNYTRSVISHPQFSETPKHAAEICWRNVGHQSGAGNCAVARTSILGLHHYNSHAKVIQNSVEVCSITHSDPRCIASCVAVSTALSLIMQQRHLKKKSGNLDVEEVVDESYRYASRCLLGRPAEEFKSLKKHMQATNLKELNLGDPANMSFTFKAVGAGFWALRQKDFRSAIQDIVMEGGDADANAAVAGALLGCKLGLHAIPGSWLDNLRHKGWLDELINRYLHMMERGRALPRSESAV